MDYAEVTISFDVAKKLLDLGSLEASQAATFRLKNYNKDNLKDKYLCWDIEINRLYPFPTTRFKLKDEDALALAVIQGLEARQLYLNSLEYLNENIGKDQEAYAKTVLMRIQYDLLCK